MNSFMELSDVEDSNSDIFIFGSSSLNGSQYFLDQSRSNNAEWWQWSKTSVHDDDNVDSCEDSSSTGLLFDVIDNTDSSHNDDALLVASNTCTIIERDIPKITSDLLLYSKCQKQQQEKIQANVEIRNQKGNENGDIKSNSYVQIPPSIFERTKDNESYPSKELTDEANIKLNRCENKSLMPFKSRLEESCMKECDQSNVMIHNGIKDDDCIKRNFSCFAKRKQQARMNSKKQVVGRSA